MPRPSSPLGAKASTKCPYLSLENLSIPMRQHTHQMSESRCQISEPDCHLTGAPSTKGIFTHTNTHGRATDVRCRRNRCQGDTPDASLRRDCIHRKTRTASDKHTPPFPTLRDDRRLDGCQNPLHIVQEPDVREQMSDDRHRSRTSNNDLTNFTCPPLLRPGARVLSSVLRHPPSGMEPIGVEPTTS